MIKIIPKKNKTFKCEPRYELVVTLGYGEHCYDTETYSSLVIDDEKAKKYDSASDEEMENMDLTEIMDISNCISQAEAEKIVKFFKALWTRKDKDGYKVDHIIINDGPDSFWWKEQGSMTDKEFKWFSKIYYKYQSSLFNPQIEHNWCGVVDANIVYYDENGEKFNCEVV